MTEPSLAQQTSASLMWMTLQKWVTRLGGLATMVILTRLLTPEAFGLAAAATTLLPLVYVLADVGFSSYLAQAAEADRRTISTAFWFSLTSGLVLTVAIYLLAPALAMALGNPEVAPLVQVMSLSVLIIAVASVPTALLRRRMAFRSLAVIEVTSALVAQVVAIGLAFAGGGAWALVFQVMAAQAITVVWVWVAAGWRPTMEFDRGSFRTMATYGISVVGSSLALVSRGWADTAIIVAGVGVRGMGYLNIAQRLVQSTQDLAISALFPVSMVAFSKVQDDPPRLRAAYLKASAIAHALVTPLMVFLAVSASALVPFLFGEDKAPSAHLASGLAVISLLNVGWAVDQGVHLGTGRPGRWFAFISASYALAVLALAMFIRYGLDVAILVWIVTSTLESIGRWILVGSLIQARPWRVAFPLLGVLVPGGVAAAAGVGVMMLGASWPAFPLLAATGTCVVSVYLVALRILRTQVFTDTVLALPHRINKLLRWSLPKSQRSRGDSTSVYEAEGA